MKHLSFKDVHNFFAQKSLLIRWSLIFIFFSFIFGMWFFFVFDKFSNKLDQIEQEIIILKKNKILLNKLIKQKSENIGIVLDLKKHIANLYPNDLDLNQILNIAHNSGLELLNYGMTQAAFAKTDPENKNTIEKIDNNLVPLSFKGNFHQILEFITKNLENKKLFRFEKINIIKLQDNLLKFDCIFNCINNYENT